MEDRENKLALYDRQIALLLVVIATSFFSLYTLLKIRKNAACDIRGDAFDENRNGLIINIITLGVIILYWQIAYERYEQAKKNENITPDQLKVIELNLLSRTLLLIAVVIDLYVLLKTIKATNNNDSTETSTDEESLDISNNNDLS